MLKNERVWLKSFGGKESWSNWGRNYESILVMLKRKKWSEIRKKEKVNIGLGKKKGWM